MCKSRKLIIVGAGGLGLEALWVAQSMNADSASGERWDILGFADDSPKLQGKEHYGYRVICRSAEVPERFSEEIFFCCAIGVNRTRKKTAEFLEASGKRAATLKHPSALIGTGAEIGPGTYVCGNAFIGPWAKVGRHVVLNVGSCVGHQSAVGDFAQVCPGAKVLGNCRLGELAFIGSNASIHPGKIVGEGVTVAANSFVANDIEPWTTVIGTPAGAVFRSKKRYDTTKHPRNH